MTVQLSAAVMAKVNATEAESNVSKNDTYPRTGLAKEALLGVHNRITTMATAVPKVIALKDL